MADRHTGGKFRKLRTRRRRRRLHDHAPVNGAPRLHLTPSINAMLSATSAEPSTYRTETIFSLRRSLDGAFRIAVARCEPRRHQNIVVDNNHAPAATKITLPR